MTGSTGRLARPAAEGLSFRKSHVNRKDLVRFTKSKACVAANKNICRAAGLTFPQTSAAGVLRACGPRARASRNKRAVAACHRCDLILGGSSRKTNGSRRHPCACTEAAVILARRRRRSRAAAAGFDAVPENRSPRPAARFRSVLLPLGSESVLKGCHKSPPLGDVSAHSLRRDINLRVFRGPWRKRLGTCLASARRYWCCSESNESCRRAESSVGLPQSC